MALSAYFTLKSVFGQQGCRALTIALARLSCMARRYILQQKYMNAQIGTCLLGTRWYKF